MRGLSVTATLAAGIRLPGLRCFATAVSLQSSVADVSRVRTPEHGHGQHDLRQDPYAAARVARRGVVPDQPEARHECFGFAAGAGPGELPDGLDHAASFSPRDGAPGPRSPEG